MQFMAFVQTIFNCKICVLHLFHLTFTIGLYGYLMYVPPYLVEIGLTKVQIASLLSIDGVFYLIGRVTIGFVCNHPKVNMYTLIAVNSAISGCFDLILPLMLSTMPVYPVVAANMAVSGLLVGGTIGLNGQLIVNAVGIERSGTGLRTTSFGISIMFGRGGQVSEKTLNKLNKFIRKTTQIKMATRKTPVSKN